MKTIFNEPFDSLPIYMTDKDLARITPYSRSTYQHWRIKGMGPTYRNIHGRIYYERDAVFEYFHGG